MQLLNGKGIMEILYITHTMKIKDCLKNTYGKYSVFPLMYEILIFHHSGSGILIKRRK